VKRDGECIELPATALERVGDLANRDRGSIWVLDRHLGTIVYAVWVHAFQIHVGDGSLWGLDINHLLCHKMFGLA